MRREEEEKKLWMAEARVPIWDCEAILCLKTKYMFRKFWNLYNY